MNSPGATLAAILLLPLSALSAQTPPGLARERADYSQWLTASATSPLKAVARQSLENGLRLGPADSDIPLPGIEDHQVLPDGKAWVLEGPHGRTLLGRDRPYRLGAYTILLAGSSTATVVTIFGSGSDRQPPGYFPYDPSLVFATTIDPPQSPVRVRVLGPDGIQMEATEAGSILLPLAGGSRLKVLRMRGATEEESELEIFFGDGTNGRNSYPAGRFVNLVPIDGGRYRVDFNRARNPFCAYSPVYPCPAPWRGNLLHVPVPAGERYKVK
jgi:uncharacterized protein DUF1684